MKKLTDLEIEELATRMAAWFDTHPGMLLSVALRHPDAPGAQEIIRQQLGEAVAHKLGFEFKVH